MNSADSSTSANVPYFDKVPRNRIEKDRRDGVIIDRREHVVDAAGYFVEVMNSLPSHQIANANSSDHSQYSETATAPQQPVVDYTEANSMAMSAADVNKQIEMHETSDMSSNVGFINKITAPEVPTTTVAGAGSDGASAFQPNIAPGISIKNPQNYAVALDLVNAAHNDVPRPTPESSIEVETAPSTDTEFPAYYETGQPDRFDSGADYVKQAS